MLLSVFNAAAVIKVNEQILSCVKFIMWKTEIIKKIIYIFFVRDYM